MPFSAKPDAANVAHLRMSLPAAMRLKTVLEAVPLMAGHRGRPATLGAVADPTWQGLMANARREMPWPTRRPSVTATTRASHGRVAVDRSSGDEMRISSTSMCGKPEVRGRRTQATP